MRASVKLSPSSIYKYLLVSVHLLACCLAFLADVPEYTLFAVLVLISVSASCSYRIYNKISQIQVIEFDWPEFKVICHEQSYVTEIVGKPFVTSMLLCFTLRIVEKHQSKAKFLNVVIFPDSADVNDLRRLRVSLKCAL